MSIFVYGEGIRGLAIAKEIKEDNSDSSVELHWR